jgi:formimidoylglutamate deiminase
LPGGWTRQVELAVSAQGDLLDVRQVARMDSTRRIGRFVLPGLPNLHSHAFQRAMAGLAERAGPERDSFWTWRETMYHFAARLTPETQAAIAAQLYVEMLKAGYTAVAEFHYLHHASGGHLHDPVSAMSDALLAAADATGIGMTLLPVLYQTGGFDGRHLAERQRRFVFAVDDFLRFVDQLRARRSPQTNVGVALHSLRAVPPESLKPVLASIAADTPIHIHIAEQTAEVDDCVAARGQRPIAWLLDHAEVDGRWCLVHATHCDPAEVAAMAKSGAVVGLCPTTEANLGDGVFPLRAFLEAGGAFGIGSDSHVSIDPVEELRWLEYGQRLVTRQRNVAADARHPSTAANLWGAAVLGGARACGRKIGALAVGHRADLIVLDDHAVDLAGRDVDRLLDTWLFASQRNVVKDVMVGGRYLVRDRKHVDEERIEADYRKALQQLAK